ncbi:hypothetical protein ACQKWADRAFT_326950 [Trichoderma austrokoningii]
MEPTDQDAHFNEIRDHLNSLHLRPEDHMKALDELIPDPKELHDYAQYIFRRTFPCLSNPAGVCTPARFIELVDAINFLDPAERKDLLPALTFECRPWIPLGFDDTTCYRLLPSLYNLLLFLCVNTAAEPLPLNRRALDLSEESTKPEAPGFIFHELGTLQCPTNFKDSDDYDGDWEETGFSVVARLSASGHIDGVYIIYNMNPRDAFTWKREKVTHSKWGILPSSPGEQFSCARIGKAMGDFGFMNKLAWNDQIQHPVELVRVVKAPMGVRRVGGL